MANAELAIIIKAKDESSGAINKIKSSLGGLGGVAKTAGIGLGIATAGVGALAAVGFSFAKAAAEEQAGVAKLDQAIKNLGGNTAEMIAQSKEAVKQSERLAFSDDETRDSLALLVAQTGDYADAQNRLKVAQNLARGANLDLATASRLVGKITDENVQVLKRYGITLKDGATETEALAEIQKRFGGQAEAFAESGAGGWQRFNNELQNVKESIGAGLLPLFTLASKGLADFMAAHQEDIERISVLIGVKLAGAIQGLVEFFIRHKETINGFWQSFKTGLDTVRPLFEYIMQNKPLIIAAILAIGVAIVIALGPEAAAVLAIIALITLIGYLRDNWRDVLKSMKENAAEFMIAIAPILGPLGIPLLLAGIWMNGFELRDKLKQALDNIVGYFVMLPGRILSAIAGLGADIAAELNPLNHLPGGSFVGGMVRKIPGFATGGFVPGPVGTPRLAVVHGGEQVLTPEQQMGGGGGITINVYADMSDSAIQKLSSQVQEATNVALRRTGMQGSFMGGGVFQP